MGSLVRHRCRCASGCAGLVALVALLASAPASAREIVVGPGAPSGGFATIQDAVAAASSGDVIRVQRGVYRENVKMRATGVTIVGNEAVLDGQGGDGIWPSGGSTLRGLVIVNCEDAVFISKGVRGVTLDHLTIVANRDQAVVIMDGAQKTTIRNSIVWQNGDGLFNQGQAAVTADHNLVFGSAGRDRWNLEAGAGDVSADPQLANPAGGDFRLSYGSPARGKASDGQDLGAPFFGEPLPVVAGLSTGGPGARGSLTPIVGVASGDDGDDDGEDSEVAGGGSASSTPPGPGKPAQPQAPNGKMLVVAQDGSGTYRTIADALAAAASGDTILVRPGVYREQVEPKIEGVILQGDNAVIDGSGGTSQRDGFWPSNRSTVRGFVIVNCDDAVFITSRTHDVLLENNTILFNSGQAVVLMNELGAITLRNNIFWRNGDGIYNQGRNQIDAHHNVVFANTDTQYYISGPGTGDLAVDPTLEGPEQGDFRLRANSPARGAGVGGTDIGAPFKQKVAWQLAMPGSGSSAVATGGSVSGAPGSELVVAQDGSGRYTSISAALAVAKPGDTIRVKAGVYRENLQSAAERLTIIGEGAVVQGSGNGQGFWPGSGSTLRGFVITGMDDAIFVTSGVHDVVIENNTIVGNSGQAIVLMYDVSNVTIRNNVMWHNNDGIYNQGQSTTIDAHHNLVFENTSNNYYHQQAGAGDVAAAPRFEDPDKADYRLRADSPARKAGVGGVDLGATGTVTGQDVGASTSGSQRAARLSVEVLFTDTDGDGTLAAGEDGAIAVTVRNQGSDAVGAAAGTSGGAVIKATLVSPPRGVSLKTTEAPLLVLQPGGTASTTFAISAAPSARLRRPVTARFTVVLPGGKNVAVSSVDIPLGK